MKKTLPAILAAFIITLCVGVGMLLVGGAALMNRNGTTVSNSPNASNVSEVKNVNVDQAQVQQQQDLVAQYQQRDKKYQEELAKAAQQLQQQDAQLQQANAQIQQYQMLLQALQSRGLIVIGQDGRIFLPGN